MHPIDWAIVAVYLVWIVWDGLRLTKDSDELEGYFLGGRSLPWWAVGLSVMATQLSAITMIGTTGQGYTDGMRFLQFYFALPLAMIVLSVTLVPFFHRAERLHRLRVPRAALRRQDARASPACCSCSRAACRSAWSISAPAVVLSVVLGLNVTATALLIALPTVVYTMFGGVQAVTWTDVKQMVLIVVGLVAAVVVLVLGLPDDVSVVDGAAASPARPAGCRRSTSRSTSPTSTRSGRARSPRFPLLLVLRHRPEPGAALPDDPSRSTRRAARC